MVFWEKWDHENYSINGGLGKNCNKSSWTKLSETTNSRENWEILHIQGCHRNCKIKFQDFFRSFSRTFAGLFKIFLQDLKFNFHFYSFMHPLFELVIEKNVNATHWGF